MSKKSLRKDGKFVIAKKGSLEDNIKKLESELEVMSSGAPRITEETDHAAQQAPVREDKPEARETQPVKTRVYRQAPPASHTYTYTKTSDRRTGKPFYLNTKVYILLFSFAALAYLFTRAPIFKYTTPFRHDMDFPQLEIAFKYYNNILGKQTKQETILKIGEKAVIIPMYMEKWVNLDVSKKKLVLDEYLYK